MIPMKLCGIPPMIIAMGAVSVGAFEGEKRLYCKVDEVIAWYENEATSCGRRARAEECRTIASNLRSARDRIARGDRIDVVAG